MTGPDRLVRPELTRRELLRLGLGGAGALAAAGLLAACGGGPATNVLTASTFSQLIKARESAGDTSGLQVNLAGGDYVADVPNYLGFYLNKPGANGSRIFGTNARLWVTPTANPDARLTPTGPLDGPFYRYAHPDGPPPLPQGLNAATVSFPQAGIYTLVVETTAGKPLIGTTYVQVQAAGHSATLLPGQKAYASVTPTVADHQGVDPICTRTPACDMHQITLAEAVANGKPTAFIIATPAFCQSRNCGPSLDELLAVEARSNGQANFVHAEVYVNDQPATIEKQVTTPTFNQWGVVSEPWLFLIDRTGVVRARFEGGFTAGQVQAALQPLLG